MKFPRTLVFLLSTTYLSVVSARAILGVDLGSLYMKVALVQSGSPLEIVTNLHSKRKTEQMILFDNNHQRFYGADASALLARKSQKTPIAMSVLLGRDEQHPVVQVLGERHYPLTPQYNETRAGVTLTVDGQAFTPEELVAMVLSHAVDIAVAYSTESGNTIAPPRDVVLTVPMYSTVKERLALLDAASLADMNVLTLIDENTAAALHYAMDKNFEEQEQLLLFYNLGASALQVSLVRFFNYEQPQKYGKPKSVPSLEVLAKAWDETCGGLAFDHLITEFLADEFEKVYKGDKDIRQVPRAMTKLRLQANKVKHVLSANNEIPVHLDSVLDEVSLHTKLSRNDLESMAQTLLERAVAPVQKVLDAANKTLADLTGTELIGGGMRIPSVQTKLSEALGGNLDLGMHINSDESFALGAAFAGANISTAFRVRSVGMTDINPFAMSVSLSDLDVAAADEEEVWSKQATIFKEFGKVGVKKTIAFTHDKDVHCSLDYVESDILPKGTDLALQRYNVSGIAEFAKEMEALGKPKVSLQFELSSSGITSLVKAEAAVEETYMVEEEVEVDEEEAVDENAADESAGDEAKGEDADKNDDEKADDTEEAEGDDAENKTEATDEKKKEKPKKTIKVEKEKKKVHKKTLNVSTYYVGRVKPHSEELLEESRNKLLEMAQNDKERMMLEEARNKVESYIYKIKNKLTDDEEEIEKFTNKKQRAEAKKLADDAEEWLYEDGYTADLATMEDKFAELSVPFEKILLRISESTARPKMIEQAKKKLTDIEDLMKKWEEAKPQVTEEERTEVLEKVTEARKWIEDMEKKQEKTKSHDDPAYLSEEVPAQLKPIEKTVVRLSRKPKPKPEKKEEDAKNETDASTENATSTGDNETLSEETTGEDSSKTEEDSSKTEEDSTKTEEDSTKTEAASEKEESEQEATEKDSADETEGIQEEL